jgi:hypothetical protein
MNKEDDVIYMYIIFTTGKMYYITYIYVVFMLCVIFVIKKFKRKY